jgi:hypothetical protein
VLIALRADRHSALQIQITAGEAANVRRTGTTNQRAHVARPRTDNRRKTARLVDMAEFACRARQLAMFGSLSATSMPAWNGAGSAQWVVRCNAPIRTRLKTHRRVPVPPRACRAHLPTLRMVVLFDFLTDRRKRSGMLLTRCRSCTASQVRFGLSRECNRA